MKKTVAIYMTVLLGVFGVLSVLGQGSDYVIERKVWKIYKQQVDIAKDPTVVPDKSFERVINAYRRIIGRYPGSRITPGLHIRVGEIYALKQDYEEARKIFLDIPKLYPDDRELSAEAVFKVGKTYEVADHWPEALNVYQGIIRDYPLTEVGLSSPIYIANYYKRQNDFQKTMESYEDAIRRYSKIASDHSHTQVGLSAMRHLSNCYLDQNRWAEAIKTLGAILEKYAASKYLHVKDVDMIIKTINIVSAYQLKDYDVAIQLYQGIISRNPEHPLTRYLMKVIDAFNQLKDKGIQVTDRQ